jgi:hypothetical protein
MENVVKQYPEFGYTVEYQIDGKTINWTVKDEGDETIMVGVFKSDEFYRSTFTIPSSNITENMYENLFYLYFENIKLVCIEVVEEDDNGMGWGWNDDKEENN